MPSFEFSVDVVVMVLSVISSLIFSYFPKLNEWFASKPENYKKFFMLGLLFLISAGSFGLACAAILPIEGFVCGKESLIHFVWIFILAVLSNQGIYNLSPQTDRVTAIKATAKEKDKIENIHLAA